ncbi:MAG: 50S ribosome-binding protein YggL [Gemmatimonadota bacterium]
MRKRLRKKQRLAEFQELEIPVTLRLDEKLDEAAIDSFLHELSAALEARGLVIMGSGDVEWYGAIARLERGSVNEEHRAFVQKLLSTDPRVKAASVEPLRDAWHGNFQAA